MSTSTNRIANAALALALIISMGAGSFAAARDTTALQMLDAAAEDHTPVATIDRISLKSKLDKGERLILVEALPHRMFKRSHLPDSINLDPVWNLRKRAPRKLKDKNAPIVVYCLSSECGDSFAVARELITMGYSNVRVFEEGLKGWIAAGYPLAGRHPNSP